ncbi:MAG TPA: glycosyltransferase family 87 protein [Tepidisphaeraceae bacterium]|nr:glycosyltransferase family 87 protein [Tepidisphaeraceae bacterium]
MNIRFPLPKLALLQPAPLRKRLWQAAFALLAVLLTFTIGNFFIPQDKAVGSRMLGHDFMAFYTAGTFARNGQFDKLYDLDAVRISEQDIAQQNNLEVGKSFGPYWNPPFYAWLPAAFAGLSYRPALAAWTGVNLICLLGAIILLIRFFPPSAAGDWRNSLLVLVLIITSMPFVQAISHGQNTFMSLLLLTLVVTAWRSKKPAIAGLFCGLLFYKPQLAAVVAIVLGLSMGIRAMLGLGFVGGVLLLVTLLTMPGTFDEYLVRLPLNLKYMQVDHTYLWERHVTLKAFWRLLFQGRQAGEASLLVNLLTWCSCGLILLGLGGAWWRSRKAGNHDRLIATTIVSMPLLMPFYFDYDLLLLSAAVMLLAAELVQRPAGMRLNLIDRLLVGSWIGLYAWLMVNPPLAAASGVNVAVVLLGTIGGLSIVRACRQHADSALPALPPTAELDIKRAA